MMIYIINKLIIAFLILLVVPIGAYAISSEWSCSYGDPPFGDIEISYTNKDAINKAEIYAINPQKHPVIYPGGELALQLNSERCFEFTLVIKDSDGNEASRYSENPYSTYLGCDLPVGELSERRESLTLIIFNAPYNPGRYTLNVYDDQNVLLVTGAIDILDPSTTVSSVSRTSWCTINDARYSVILNAPYPIVFEKNNPGKISVIIRGPDTSIINEMFEQISMSISPQYADQSSLTKTGSLVCSNGECRQDYSLISSTSTSAIAYVWQEIKEPTIYKSSVNSKGITLLDIGKLKEIKLRLNKLSNTALEYVEYYDSINDNEKARIWQNVYDKSNSMLDEINDLILVFESRNFKISDIVNLINIVEKSQRDIDEIINSLSGV